MDEIGLAQQFLNLFLLMGVMFVVFYSLIYGALWLGVAVERGAEKEFSQ